MNVHLLLFLLLPVAAASGWYVGSRSPKNTTAKKTTTFSHNYFKGLNYLLNEQPDKAVDIFIKMLEIDSDTVDTYLAIGSLFRRRGEVERAIRVHQNLIARPNLEKHHRIRALIELGKDYMSAGVYDRAERLFLETEDISDRPNPIAYKNLLLIYQQEKEWYQAIEYAEKLLKNADTSVSRALANYYCELVEDKRQNFSCEKKLALVNKALSIDANSVRASLLKGELYMQQGKYHDAIDAYSKVKQQDSDFLAEIIEPLAFCYEKIDKKSTLIDYLYQCLMDSPQLNIILTIADKLYLWHGEKIAIDFLTEQLHKYPSIVGIEHLMQFYKKAKIIDNNSNFEMLHLLMKKLLGATPNYQCGHCGFLAKSLQWSCPSCRRWNTIKPIIRHVTHSEEQYDN